ncbi:MAG: Hsp70 family protein, partial [Gammaproteobacteria bacterium]|nr:Hsp70 family protein [Gammaproteobacteria bacterium]
SAKDKATGKEQKIVIKASSGLSDDEIDRMVNDAETHAEEDKKFRELVDVRNQADQMLHATEKSLEDLGDKVDGEERARIESAIAELKDAMKADDKERIETKSKALAEASATMAQKAYEQAAEADGGAERGSAADDGVVDAEFEEVKDDEKKAS